MKNILFLSVLLMVAFAEAQDKEKIKGNREPVTRLVQVEPFTTIEISDNWKISLIKGELPQVEILTDSNLQEVIDIDVVGQTLSISSLKDIRSSKELKIKIVYNEKLTSIIASKEAEVYSLNDLNFETIKLEAKEDAKLFLTIKTKNLELTMRNDAEAEMNIKADNATISLFDDSEIEALINANLLHLNQVSDAKSEIEGDVKDAELIFKDDAEFTGENLSIKSATIDTSGDSKIEINVSSSLNLTAKNDSETYLYSKPSIVIKEFSDSSLLQKK